MLDFSGSYAFNPLALPPLIVGSATLALGIAAVIRERGAATSLHFLLLNLTVALWLLSSAATYSATDGAAALRWSRLTHVGVHLIPGALYSFATNAVGVSERRRPLIWGTWLISGLFLALTPELVREVYPYWWGYFARYSWANVSFLIFFAAALTAAASEFWSAYRRAEPGSLAQRRSWLLLLALLVGYAASVD